MQCVAKFVEHRRDISKADQSWFAFGGLWQVGYVVNHRKFSQQTRLFHKRRHPRSAILVVPFEIIAVEKREVLAIRVEDLEDAHIGMVHGKIVTLFESESIELIGSVEHSILQHVVQLKIRLYLRIIDVVTGLANLIGVVSPVPGLELESAVLTINDPLAVSGFLGSLCGGSRHDSIHEPQSGRRSLRHLVFNLPRRVTWISQ